MLNIITLKENKIGKILLKNINDGNISSNKNILITGNITNFSFSDLSKFKLQIHTQNFFHIKNYKIHDLIFNLLIYKKIIQRSSIIVYFWPKSKIEALFQLQHIFSLLREKQGIFIVGNNKSGVRCSQNLLQKWIVLTKIDSSNHCILYFGNLIHKPKFQYENFIKNNIWNNIIIKTIPGVFSYGKIDNGTKLLISTLNEHSFKWKKALDIGCGSGILSVYLMKNFQNIRVTSIDSNIAALESSKLTFLANNVKGTILLSDIYSNIDCNNFDLIISNPPLHVDKQINLTILEHIIKNSTKFLSFQGQIRIVVLKNIPCRKIFKCYFNKYTVLKEDNNFVVYQANYKDKI